MPHYEIGISDKQPVVFDIGAAYTKLGFAGDSAPRAIIPTEVRKPETKSTRKVFRYQDKQDLYRLLVDFVHSLYFRHLLVSPKDRRVVIVESLLCPTVFRETLAAVLFCHFEVSSVLFVPSHLATLCTLGVNTALVLDVGYQESVLVPIYESVAVLHAWQAQPLAGAAVESRLKSMLFEHWKNKDDLQTLDDLPDSVVEDLKVRTCFVTTLERSLKAKTSEPLAPPPEVAYNEGNIPAFSMPGFIREGAFEVLFEQDGDETSVATLILDAIVKCSVDMRRQLAENILLIGGTASALGFKARLKEELLHLLKTSKYAKLLAIKTFKFHVPPAKENYVAWLGGSIYAATDIILTRSLTKEMYLKKKEVPDWSSLAYNTLEKDIL